MEILQLPTPFASNSLFYYNGMLWSYLPAADYGAWKCWCLNCTSGESDGEGDTTSSYIDTDTSSQISPSHRVEKTNKWNFPPALPPPLPLPGWQSLPYGLERFWMSAFMWLFRQWYEQGQLWSLKPVSKPPKTSKNPKKTSATSWHTVVHSAKVRFNCPEGHGWTSVHGRAVFWFRMRPAGPSAELNGEVLFKLYGQKCENCNSTTFETALWYPEEIANALLHLFSRVGERCYALSSVYVVERVRQGLPVGPHNTQLCQACSDGVCTIKKIKKKDKVIHL